MKFNESKGLKTNRWLQNELAMSEDFNFLGMNGYKNFSDLMAAIAEQGVESGSGPNIIISGLLLEWSTVLTSYLRTGIAVSFKGYYLDDDGNWGFNSSSGDVFAIKVGLDQAVAVDAGGASARHDTIEIRPVITNYDTESRKFKDPVTGTVTSSNMETKVEYGVEVQILKGTGGAGVAPTHTAGWIKVAEVYVDASATVIGQGDILDVRDSALWTTEASNTVYKTVTQADKVPILDAGSLIDSTEVESALQELANILVREDVTSNITMVSPKKYLVSGNHELTLPTAPSKGETIDVLSDGYPVIKQSDANQVINYKNKHFTTKGTTGYVQMFSKDQLKLVYKGSGLSPIEPGVKLSSPATLPPNDVHDCAFSYDGTYLAVSHVTTPFITIYKRTAGTDTFVKLADPAYALPDHGYGLSFSYDGTYLAVSCVSTPYIVIYKRSGDTFTKLTNPAILPAGSSSDCAFSYDGTYLAVGHVTTPFITIYKRTAGTDTFVKLTNPTALPASNGNCCVFSYDGNYLVVGHPTSPYITIYKRSGDTFTKLSNPATLPSWTLSCCDFSYDGTYLAVGESSPSIDVYKRLGDTFERLPDLPSLPTTTVRGLSFSYDGTYLAAVSDVTPYIAVYKRSGDTFIKLTNPAALAGAGFSCHFSYDGTYLAVGHVTTPFITIYKVKEATTKVWITTDFETMNPADPSDGDGGDLQYRFK